MQVYSFASDAIETAAVRAQSDAIRQGFAFDFIPHAPGFGAATDHGTDGRVYGGACDLVHIPDGRRRDAGRMVGEFVERVQRMVAKRPDASEMLLCPGCYMIALVNAAVWLAENNGQSLAELGATMARAFQQIAETGSYEPAMIEEIEVIGD